MAKGSSRMLNGGQDFPPKDDDHKFFSRLLSRERYNPSKQGEASFRVLYYGGATSSVPFLWESQPGTPKHTFNDNPPLPLTPPPYYQSSPRANPLMQKINSKNSKILNFIFPKTPSKKVNAFPLFSPHSSSSSSFSFSSSHSLPSTLVHARKNNNTKARSESIVQFGGDGYEYEARKHSPTSTLCFGSRGGSGSGSQSRRINGYYYPIKSVKKVVLSIVGHGGTAN